MTTYTKVETTFSSDTSIPPVSTSTCPNSVSDWCSTNTHDWIDQDNSDDDDDPAEQEQFDRISGILSQLIEEANNAIQSTSTSLSNQPVLDDTPSSTTECEHPSMTSDMVISNRCPSKLPRLKRLSLDTTLSYRHRSLSITSSSSSSTMNDDTLFSPISSELTTPMSRTISPLLFEKHTYTTELNQEDDSLMSSFERLDSSLAIVDYLSRDLANYRRQHPRSLSMDYNQCIPFYNDADHDSKQNHYDWTWILMLPLLYIPYLLITTLWNELLLENTDEMQWVPPSAGLAVFVLTLTILHLLCSNKQKIVNNHDRSKIIRRSSLPLAPSSPSYSRRYSF